MRNNRVNSGYPGRQSAYEHRKRRRRRKTILISAVLITTAAIAALAFYVTIKKDMLGKSHEIYASEGGNDVVQKPKETIQGNEGETENTRNGHLNGTDHDLVSGENQGQTDDAYDGKAGQEPEQNGSNADQEAVQKTDKDELEANQNKDMAYDFTKPVPESDKVEESYFDDAVFIGDSRTEGFINTSGLSNTTVYAHKGLMVDTVFTSPVIDMAGSKISVMDALERSEFTKVYVMLGVNETGWPYDSVFIDKYKTLIEKIKKINPDASIYVQSILPVSSKVSSTHSYVKNEKIDQYNELIQAMTKEEKVYYVNVREAVADKNGALPEEAAVDGIHLKKDYCLKWLEYLKTHTI